jgi:hypothetical protein
MRMKKRSWLARVAGTLRRAVRRPPDSIPNPSSFIPDPSSAAHRAHPRSAKRRTRGLRQPVAAHYRRLFVEPLETRRLLTVTIAQLLAEATPDPHPTGDQPANPSQLVDLSNYTAPSLPDPGIAALEPYIEGMDAIYASIAANPAARPSYWGQNVAAAGNELRLYFNDNGMLTEDWKVGWGDGSAVQNITVAPGQSSPPWVVYQYAAAGTYNIQVTAVSIDGTYTTDASSVWVNSVGIGGGYDGGLTLTLPQAPPTLHVAGAQTVAEGASFALDNLASISDADAMPSGDVTAWTTAAGNSVNVTSDYSYTIDWGDGSAPFNGSNVEVINAGGSGQPFLGALSSNTPDGPLTHVYTDPGTYNVAVTVTENSSSLSDTQIIPVTVVQLAPTISMTVNGGPCTNNTCNEGDTLGLSATVAESASLADPVSYAWQITDSEGNLVAQGTDPAVSITLSYADTYTVSLTATVDNISSAAATATITVNLVAPSFVGPSLTVNLGQACNLDVPFTDLDPQDTHTAVVQWNNLDSSTIDNGATVTEETLNGTTVVPGTITDSYTYPAAEDYTGTITVTDSEGVSQSETFTVDVVSAAVTLTDFASNGTDLEVSYNVTGAASAGPFNINVYTSPDGSTPDQLLMSAPVTGSGNLTETTGTPHTFTFAPSFDDVQSGYHLIAVADANPSSAVEFDGGVFIAPSVTASPPQDILYVFGRDGSSGDAVTIEGAADSPANEVVFNGTDYPISSSITGIHVRGEAGNDTFTAESDATLPVWFFGGSGANTITGGGGSNLIAGGSGSDTLTGGSGPNQIEGGSGAETLIGGQGSNQITPGSGTNTVNDANALSGPVIVDDGETSTNSFYQKSGTWTSETVAGAFDGEELLHASAGGSDYAAWTFDVPDPTAYYDVYVTWTPIAGASTDAQFSVWDGGTEYAGGTQLEPIGQTGITAIDQMQDPGDYQAAGAYWDDLGVFQVSTDKLVVQLGTADALADAVMIFPYQIPPLTNLTMGSFTVDSQGNLSVGYTVNGEDSPPFLIGIYGSPDGVQPATLLQTYEVDDPTLLAGGGQSYTAAFPASLDDIDSCEYVIAQHDSGDAVEETSKADNISAPLSGVFEQQDGTLVVLGNASTLANESISLTQDISGDVTVGTADLAGDPISSSTYSGVSSVIVDTPGGGNTVAVDPSVTVPVSVFAGPGGVVNNTAGMLSATDAAPAVTITNIQGTISKGGMETLAANVSNLDGQGFTATIDWGAYEASDTIVYPPGTTSISLTHHYVDFADDPFNIVFPLTVTVAAGDSGPVSAEATIFGQDVLPTVNIAGGSGGVPAGSPQYLSAVVADPGESSTFTYSWTVSPGSITSESGQTTADFSFVPLDNVNYTVSVAVTDGDGNTANKSVTVPIGSGTTYSPFVGDVPTVSIEQCDCDESPDSSDVAAGDTAYFLFSVSNEYTPDMGTVNVFWNTANDTAVANTDFIASGDQELTFPWDPSADCGAGGYDPQRISVNTVLTANGGTFTVDARCELDEDADTPGTDTYVYCTVDQGLTIKMETEASPNAIPVTNQTVTVIVGQWIELFGSNGPVQGVEGWSCPDWNTNPPDAVAGYKPQVSSAIVTPLKGANISGGTLENLYWTRWGTYTVTYTVNYKDAAGNPQSISVSTTFDVEAPPTTFSAVTTPVTPAVDVRSVALLGQELRFGVDGVDRNGVGQYGMNWTISGMQVAAKFTGTVALVQLVKPLSETFFALLGTTDEISSTYGRYILDDPPSDASSPLTFPNSITIGGMTGTIQPASPTRTPTSPANSLHDSPFQGLPAVGGAIVKARDTFKTYLMYRPMGPDPEQPWTKSIFVSLDEMSWFWSGRADRKGIWFLQAGDYKKNPKASPDSTLPQWSGYATDFSAKPPVAVSYIKGKVVGPNGQPVVGATVILSWPDPNYPSQTDTYSVETDANGNYLTGAGFGNGNVVVTDQATGAKLVSTPQMRGNSPTASTPLNFQE